MHLIISIRLFEYQPPISDFLCIRHMHNMQISKHTHTHTDSNTLMQPQKVLSDTFINIKSLFVAVQS